MSDLLQQSFANPAVKNSTFCPVMITEHITQSGFLSPAMITVSTHAQVKKGKMHHPECDIRSKPWKITVIHTLVH